jgi:pimeloyl-ACP methyl ester carboxylesterase
MDMPTLVLSGAQDVVAPEELQAEMANALPWATWTEVANAGHFLLLEQPAACSAAFSTWLGQVDLHQSRAERQCADISTYSNASEVS